MATKKTATKAAKKTADSSADAPKPVAKKAAAKKTPATEAATESTASQPVSKKKQATHDEIAQLAHKYWKERGGHHGSHNDDWLRAEKELNS